MQSSNPVQEPKIHPDSVDGESTAVVNRILASAIFERTHRLCELLRYLNQHTVEGNAQALKEAAIGQALFGRPADYNAADDNIVRANMRQLRMKLDEYYQTTGASDPWRLSIPKGSYALKLTPVEAALEPPAAAATTPARSAEIPRWVVLAGVALAALAISLAWQYAGYREPGTSLLSLLTPAPGQKVLIVGPDAGAQFYREYTERSVPLEEYLNRRYAEPENLKRVAPDLPPSITRLFSASVTEMFVAGLIPAFAKVIPPDALSVPPPISLAVKDFERDNAVLISGPLGNPWVQLFDRGLNFQIESNADQRLLSHIVNRHPAGSESATYFNYKDASNTTVCYARLAYLPGMSAKTRVLLAGGPHAASTQAANLFLTRADFRESIRRLLPKRPGREFPWFEAVVEASALGTEPWTARIVAIRVVEGAPGPSSQ